MPDESIATPYHESTDHPERLSDPSRSPVRMQVVLFVITFVTLSYVGWSHSVEPAAPEDLGDVAGSFIEFLSPLSLVRALPYTLSILAILGCHEFGHYIACRIYGVPATLPFFIPGLPPFGTFGAVIRIRGFIPHRRALFDIAAAGPLAGFAVALPLMILGVSRSVPAAETYTLNAVGLGDSILSAALWKFRPEGGIWTAGPVYYAAWFGMLVTSWNLFPVGQLDGGHIAYSLSRRLHRYLSRMTIALLTAWVIFFGVVHLQPSIYTLWCLILLWMRDRHPRVSMERDGLGIGRTVLALLLFTLFILTFIPVPLIFYR